MKFITTRIKTLLNQAKSYALLFFVGMQLSYAENQLLSNLDSTAQSLGQDVVKVIGNIGAGVAVIAIVGYLIGSAINAERVKEHIKSILIVILVGGLVKAISAMSIGTIF
ncbi:hypothetical protein HpCK38_15780 [Helicobacter pylori]